MLERAAGVRLRAVGRGDRVVGRVRYSRGRRARQGMRNGQKDITVKTTAGPIGLRRPMVAVAGQRGLLLP